MQIKLFILLILFASISFGEDLPNEEFLLVVNYFMLPSLDMRLKIYHDVEFEGKAFNRIDVTTKTKKFYNKFFSIDNFYSSYFDADFSIRYHKKAIKQPNVEQELSINYQNETANYSNGKSRSVKSKTLDFFSLLMYVRKLDSKKLYNSQVTIDMEGELFDITFTLENEETIKVGRKKIATNKFKLNYKKQIPGQKSVLDYTDIFFWKIAEEGGDKYIWVEKEEPKRIIKAKFSEGKNRLEAKLVEEK